MREAPARLGRARFACSKHASAIVITIEAEAKLAAPSFDLALSASQPDLADALPLPVRTGLLLAQPDELAPGTASRALIDQLRSRWTRVLVTGLDRSGQVEQVLGWGADLLCGAATGEP